MHSEDPAPQPAPTGPNPSDTAAIEQAAALEAQVETNKRTVTDKATRALTDLSALINATDAQLNANPAANIRNLARVARVLLRLELDRYEGTD